MATGLQKTSGGLYETSTEELAKQQEAALSPTTPAGAAGRGASEDSAKMFGTDAQKKAAQRQTLDPSQTLQQARRERETLRPEDQMFSQNVAKEKLNRIKSLGGIESQLESMIQQRINDASQQQAQLALQQATIEALPLSSQAQAQDIIMAYGDAIQQGKMGGQQLKQLSTLLGREVTPAEMQSYFQQAPTALGAMAGQAIAPEQVLMSDLNLQELGLDAIQLEDDLNLAPGQLATMTYDQLQQQIQAVEAEEFNRIQNLEAELATAVGARRQQILRELGQAGQAGITGVEQEFDRLQQEIDEGRTIDVLGQEMSLEQILDDEEFSKIIEEAAMDDEALAKLEANHPGIANWVRENKQVLQNLQAEMETSVGQFQSVQSEFRGIKDVLGDELFTYIIGEEEDDYITSEEMAAINEELNKSAVYKVFQEDDEFAQRIKANPELFSKLQGMKEADIKAAWEASKELALNPALADILGLDVTSFPTDKATLDKIAALKDIDTALMSNPAFQQYYKQGRFTQDQIEAMSANPLEFDSAVNYLRMEDEIKNIGNDFDKMTDFLFGGKKVNDLNNEIDSLERLASVGDANAKKKLDELKGLIGDDLHLDKNDMKSMQSYINKNKGSLNDVISGGDVWGGYDTNSITEAGLDADSRAVADKMAAFEKGNWDFEGIMRELRSNIASNLRPTDAGYNASALNLLNNKSFKASHPKEHAKMLRAYKTAKLASKLSKSYLPAESEIMTAASDGKISYKEMQGMSASALKGLLDSDLAGSLRMAPSDLKKVLKEKTKVESELNLDSIGRDVTKWNRQYKKDMAKRVGETEDQRKAYTKSKQNAWKKKYHKQAGILNKEEKRLGEMLKSEQDPVMRAMIKKKIREVKSHWVNMPDEFK